MREFKLFILGIFCFIISLTVIGCGNETAITSKEFQTKMEAKGFTVINAKSQFSKYSYVKQAYIAINKKANYQIEFYQLSTNDYAKSFFNNNKQIFKKSKSSGSAEMSISTGYNDKYTLITGGKYKFISRIDNTVIYLNVKESNKTAVKKIIDELGY